MIIKNADVYCNNFEPIKTDITIDGEFIADLYPTDAEGEDFSGCAVLPGFIDIHIHGCNMADTRTLKKTTRWLSKIVWILIWQRTSP